MHCGSKPVGDLAAAFVSVVLLIPARCATMSLYERVSPPGCYHQQSIDNILPRIKSMQENVSRNPNQWHSRRRNSVSEASKEDAVLAVLADRLVEERLPRALALKEKVGRGEVLDDFDIAFLEQVLADARNIPQGIKDNPTFKDAAAQMMQLYNAIMSKALENEQAQKSS